MLRAFVRYHIGWLLSSVWILMFVSSQRVRYVSIQTRGRHSVCNTIDHKEIRGRMVMKWVCKGLAVLARGENPPDNEVPNLQPVGPDQLEKKSPE